MRWGWRVVMALILVVLVKPIVAKDTAGDGQGDEQMNEVAQEAGGGGGADGVVAGGIGAAGHEAVDKEDNVGQADEEGDDEGELNGAFARGVVEQAGVEGLGFFE